MNLITLIGEIDPIGSVVHFKAHEEMKLTIFLMLNHSYKMRHIEVSQRSTCDTYIKCRTRFNIFSILKATLLS